MARSGTAASEPTTRVTAGGGRSGTRGWLRRVPSRAVLAVAFVLAIAAFIVATLPFSVPGEDGQPLACGPPLYEVLVPADPAFAGPEDTACAEPARQRMVLAAGLLALALVATVVVEVRARRTTSAAQGRWLAGPRRRRRRRPSSGVGRAGLERGERVERGEGRGSGTGG